MISQKLPRERKSQIASGHEHVLLEVVKCNPEQHWIMVWNKKRDERLVSCPTQMHQ